ncbi:hypothetical protein BJ508DRAFT_367291 [Ascobolus immersus RN42]|uniref:PH domain-containing protein n=1 Tax=Ascobolus immersus RN42 TaxID=1160509 RepID=A0A3N4HRT5_ASCIM|nr:hypothetical protein BJ508DRAFT_367291 [Ascobolus immersus RN42]
MSNSPVIRQESPSSTPRRARALRSLSVPLSESTPSRSLFKIIQSDVELDASDLTDLLNSDGPEYDSWLTDLRSSVRAVVYTCIHHLHKAHDIFDLYDCTNKYTRCVVLKEAIQSVWARWKAVAVRDIFDLVALEELEELLGSLSFLDCSCGSLQYFSSQCFRDEMRKERDGLKSVSERAGKIAEIVQVLIRRVRGKGVVGYVVPELEDASVADDGAKTVAFTLLDGDEAEHYITAFLEGVEAGDYEPRVGRRGWCDGLAIFGEGEPDEDEEEDEDELETYISFRNDCKDLALLKDGIVWDPYDRHEGFEVPDEVRDIIKEEGFDPKSVQFAGDSYNVALLAGLTDIAAAIDDPSNKLVNRPVVIPNGQDVAEVLLYPAYRDGILPRNLFEQYWPLFERDPLSAGDYDSLPPQIPILSGIPKLVTDGPSWTLRSTTLGQLIGKCADIDATKKAVKVAHVTFKASQDHVGEANSLITHLFGAQTQDNLYRGARLDDYRDSIRFDTPVTTKGNILGPGVYTTPDLDLALEDTVSRPSVLLVYKGVDERGLPKVKFNLGEEEEKREWEALAFAAKLDTVEKWDILKPATINALVLDAPYLANSKDFLVKGCKAHDYQREVVFKGRAVDRLRKALHAIVYFQPTPVGDGELL